MKKKTSVEVLSASLALTLSPSLASAGSDIARDANGRDCNPSDVTGSARRALQGVRDIEYVEVEGIAQPN